MMIKGFSELTNIHMRAQPFNHDPAVLACAFLNNVRNGTDDVRATSAYDLPLHTLTIASTTSCFL